MGYDEERNVFLTPACATQDTDLHDTSSGIASVLARLGLAHPFVRHTLEEIIGELKSPDWQIRASAATALGKQQTSTSSLHALLSALHDTHESVRASAARALGHLGDPQALAALSHTLHDESPLVREAGATALGKIGIPTIHCVLEGVLHDSDVSVRAAATQALGYARSGNALPFLAQQLSDTSYLVREAAADGIGMLRNPAGRVHLLRHLHDNEEIVRDAITRALLLLEDEYPKTLIARLIREEDISIQKVAKETITTLLNLGLDIYAQHEPIAPLVVILQGTEKSRETAILCYLLGRAIEALEEQAPIRFLLIEYLCQEELSHTEKLQAWQSLRVLASRWGKESRNIRCLQSATHDAHPTVRTYALQAIEMLVDIALTLLKEQSSTEQQQIPSLLGQTAGLDSEQAKGKLLGLAFRALNEQESLTELVECLQDSDDTKRISATETLVQRLKKVFYERSPRATAIFTLTHSRWSTCTRFRFGTQGMFPNGDDKDGQIIPLFDPFFASRRQTQTPRIPSLANYTVLTNVSLNN